MFDWYGDLGKDGRRTFWACFGGYALDALDVQLYSMAIPVLIGISFITKGEAGIIATSTLVLSAVGGWAAGIMADKLAGYERYKLPSCGLRSSPRYATDNRLLGLWCAEVCKDWASAANGPRARS